MTLMHSTVIMVTRNEKIIMKIIIMTSCKIRRNKGSHSSQSLVLYENCVFHFEFAIFHFGILDHYMTKHRPLRQSGIDLVTVLVENAKMAQLKREN